jgi:RNA polymerase sigma-70 factor, ECF subfamily
MVVRRSASRDVTEAKERHLVEAARKDPAKFSPLYENNFERVYAFIARRVHDRDAAEDLTSDVFHRALASLPRFEWRGVPFAAWLLRIASNAIADRSKRVSRELSLPSFAPDAESGSNPGLGSPFEVGVDEIDERARLFRLVGELPADQRRVIVMRFAEEKSIREIAQALERTEGAVKQLQFRALENLRARMGRVNVGKRNG